jgi:hypothetical protein
MTTEEKLVRVSLIHTIFQFYKPGEITRAGEKVRKQARKSFKKLSARLGAEKSIELVKRIDKIWKSIFEEYKDKTFIASIFIISIWKDELSPYIGDGALNRYVAGEQPGSDKIEYELLTYEVADTLDKQIKEILNDKKK